MASKMLAVLLLAASLPALTEGAASCRAMTNEEVVLAERKKLGCADANPTACSCTDNGAPSVQCKPESETLWASTANSPDCVVAKPDVDENWTKHEWHYPKDYGATCKVHKEPGSYHCSKVEGKTHAWDKNSTGYNQNLDSADWCTTKWCYVNPCECNEKDFMVSSWFQPARLYYSYAKCDGVNTFTPALCSEGGATKVKCEEQAGCVWDAGTPTTAQAETDSASMPMAWTVSIALTARLILCLY